MLCGAYKMAKLATTLTLDQKDLQNLHATEELRDCLPYFSTLDFSALQIRYISEHLHHKVGNFLFT
jgi:hypothetical protein